MYFGDSDAFTSSKIAHLDMSTTFTDLKRMPQFDKSRLFVRRTIPSNFVTTVHFPNGYQQDIVCNLFSQVGKVIDELVTSVRASKRDDLLAVLFGDDFGSQELYLQQKLGIWRLPLDASDDTPRYLDAEETPFTPLDVNIRYMLKLVDNTSTSSGSLASTEEDVMTPFRVYLDGKYFRCLAAPRNVQKAEFLTLLIQSLKLPQ